MFSCKTIGFSCKYLNQTKIDNGSVIIPAIENNIESAILEFFNETNIIKNKVDQINLTLYPIKFVEIQLDSQYPYYYIFKCSFDLDICIEDKSLLEVPLLKYLNNKFIKFENGSIRFDYIEYIN